MSAPRVYSRAFLRAVALICSLSPFALNAQVMIANHGTMIVYIPTKDGMVVAADSRSSVTTSKGQQVNCDDTVKIIPLSVHRRTVIGIAGFNEFYFQPEKDTGIEPCAYRKTHEAIFSLQTISKRFLDSQKGDIDESRFNELGSFVLQQVSAFLREHPTAITDDREITTVTYGHYSPDNRMSFYGYAQICKAPSELMQVTLCSKKWNQFTPEGAPLISISGATDCFGKALSPFGRSLLGPNDLKQFDAFRASPTSRPVSDVSYKEALAVEIDVISSVAKISETLHDRRCQVGGPIKAVLLGTDHAAPFPLQ